MKLNCKIACILMVACLACFIALSILVKNGQISTFDTIVSQAVQGEQSNLLKNLAKLIAIIASPIGFILVALVLSGAGLILAAKHSSALFARAMPTMLLFAGVNLTAGITNQILKNIFQRPRPLLEVSGYSFPSGHAMLSFAFCMTMAYLFSRNSKTSRQRNFMIGCGVISTLLVGISRIYLNVHYPSDVIAGFCISGSILLVGIVVFETKMAHLQHPIQKP